MLEGISSNHCIAGSKSTVVFNFDRLNGCGAVFFSGAVNGQSCVLGNRQQTGRIFNARVLCFVCILEQIDAAAIHSNSIAADFHITSINIGVIQFGFLIESNDIPMQLINIRIGRIFR